MYLNVWSDVARCKTFGRTTSAWKRFVPVLLRLLLRLPLACFVVVGHDRLGVIAAGNVGDGGGLYPNVRVLSDGGMDAEGIHLFQKAVGARQLVLAVRTRFEERQGYFGLGEAGPRGTLLL